jgi:hypothetical protein
MSETHEVPEPAEATEFGDEGAGPDPDAVDDDEGGAD